MIVSNFYGIGVVPAPFKTNPVLIIDPDAVLSFPVAVKLFQAVSRGDSQIIKRLRAIEHGQFSFRHGGGRRAAGFSAAPDFRRLPVGETPDHRFV